MELSPPFIEPKVSLLCSQEPIIIIIIIIMCVIYFQLQAINTLTGIGFSPVTIHAEAHFTALTHELNFISYWVINLYYLSTRFLVMAVLIRKVAFLISVRDFMLLLVLILTS